METDREITEKSNDGIIERGSDTSHSMAEDRTVNDIILHESPIQEALVENEAELPVTQSDQNDIKITELRASDPFGAKNEEQAMRLKNVVWTENSAKEMR